MRVRYVCNIYSIQINAFQMKVYVIGVQKLQHNRYGIKFLFYFVRPYFCANFLFKKTLATDFFLWEFSECIG